MALDAPEIDRPAENGSVPPENRYMEGTAVPKNLVWGYSVHDPLNPIFGVSADKDGKWRYFLTLPPGLHQVLVKQSTPDSSETSPSRTRKFWMV
jgi:hypothetical protein